MFSFKEINSEEAQKIWDTSPNANIFNNPKVLNHLENIKIFGVYNGKELICCWPIKEQSKMFLIPGFFYYFGPFWSKIIKTTPNHSWLKLSQCVYELYCENFSKLSKSIEFELHHSLQDVRVFDWWNYHNNKERFLILPRYSATIDNLKKKNEQDILKDYRYVRRYELKHFEQNIKFIESTDISNEDLEKFYFDNVKIENLEKLKKEIKKGINTVYSLVKKGFGKIYSYREKKSKDLICVQLVLNDKYSSHLVLSIATKDWKKKGIMTYTVHKAILDAKKQSIDIFDFDGANSPDRGDHKHSFGSKFRLFFKLILKKKHK